MEYKLANNEHFIITSNGQSKNIDDIETVRLVSVSSNLTNQTTSIVSGQKETVLYVNSGSSTDYTIAISTTYKTPDGSPMELRCPAGGYCEVNFINISGTIYARGL